MLYNVMVNIDFQLDGFSNRLGDKSLSMPGYLVQVN